MQLRAFIKQIGTCALLAVLNFASSACHVTGPQSATMPARVDTLWYATSRQRRSDRLADRFADSLEFGYYRIASKPNADLMRGDIRMRVMDSTRITRTKFLESISAPSKDASDVVVLSVHGYATSHTKAIRDAAEAYIRSGTKSRWVAFSWPSSGHGMNLMQPGHMFLTGAYRADSVAAVRSRPAFAQLVLALHATVGGQRLVITTHSLGAQLATETLAADSLVRQQLLRSPLRAIGLFEPDIATRRFRDYTAPRLRALASRVALYASENDRMLGFSRVINHGDRAGLMGSDAELLDGVETIDVTDGLSSEDWFRRRFGTHHAMKRETSALRDFFEIVVNHSAPSCRVTRGTATETRSGEWKLLPNPSNNARCGR